MPRPSPSGSLAVLALLATGCIVGDPDDGDVDALASRGNPANTLRWSRISGACINSGGVTPNGGSVSVFFDTYFTSTCTVRGTVSVPAGVRLTSLHQFVLGDAEGVASVKYTASLDGTRITTRTVSLPAGLETVANVRLFGASLCDRAGTSPRSIPFVFTVTPSSNAYLDSVDWEFGAETCDE
jgi:hypothetical protein